MKKIKKCEMRIWKNTDGTYEWHGKNITAEQMITMGAILQEAGLKWMDESRPDKKISKKRK
jgi:hypothetical protein